MPQSMFLPVFFPTHLAYIQNDLRIIVSAINAVSSMKTLLNRTTQRLSLKYKRCLVAEAEMVLSETETCDIVIS